MISRNKLRLKRHHSLRQRIFGTSQRPRLVIFRSLKHFYASLIDDQSSGKTIVSVSDFDLKKEVKIEKKEIPITLGKMLAKKAKERKITAVVFDRSGYRYHGKIKAFAEAARNEGLKF